MQRTSLIVGMQLLGVWLLVETLDPYRGHYMMIGRFSVWSQWVPAVAGFCLLWKCWAIAGWLMPEAAEFQEQMVGVWLSFLRPLLALFVAHSVFVPKVWAIVFSANLEAWQGGATDESNTTAGSIDSWGGLHDLGAAGPLTPSYTILVLLILMLLLWLVFSRPHVVKSTAHEVITMTLRVLLETLIRLIGIYVLVKAVQSSLAGIGLVGFYSWTDIPVVLGLFALQCPIPLLLIFKSGMLLKLLPIASLDTSFNALPREQWFRVGVVAVAAIELFRSVNTLFVHGVSSVFLLPPTHLPEELRADAVLSSISRLTTEIVVLIFCLLVIKQSSSIAMWLFGREPGDAPTGEPG